MNWQRLMKRLVVEGIREAGRQATKRRPSGLEEPKGRRYQQPVPPSQSVNYPGDFSGAVDPVYDPHPDGLPDPGEIVWTWVPYEEDVTKGKDRPVLLIGRDDPWLLGLQVTSQDHDRDAVAEAREGRFWEDIGAGDWDNRRRPSEVRVNRLIRIDPSAVRRIGAVLDEETFQRVAREVRKHT